MKKKIFILGTIFGLLIGVTITSYAAYKYQASEVGYTPENSEFKVDNVESAIDELYKKTNNTNKEIIFSHWHSQGATYILNNNDIQYLSSIPFETQYISSKNVDYDIMGIFAKQDCYVKILDNGQIVFEGSVKKDDEIWRKYSGWNIVIYVK